MSANSAVKARIYPNHHQRKLLDDAFVECVRWYNLHLDWFKECWEPCAKQYADFCAAHQDDVDACKAFAKTLPWPSKTKMGWPMSVVMPKEKYTARFGELKFVCFNMMNDAVEDDLSKAIKTTKRTSDVRFASSKKRRTFCVVIKSIETRIDSRGRVKKLRIPFLSPKGLRKTEPETEWFDCRLSDELLNTSLKQTAITVTRNNSGEYFASIRVEQPEKKHEETGVECGIDLGVKTAVVAAHNAVGEQSAEYDKHSEYDIDKEKIKRIESTIEHLQKMQSRRIRTWMRCEQTKGNHKDLSMHGKGCHNATAVYIKRFKSELYKKTEHRIAQLNLKLANIRKDFHEKLSRTLRDGADTIGIEDLNVKGMAKNRHLARSVNRIGFYQMRVAIERKFGKDNVSVIDRFAPSSKTCSKCGHLLTKQERNVIGFGDGARGLKVRTWTCPECGELLDRDMNAASNLRPSKQGQLLSNMKSMTCQSRCTGDCTDKTAETKNTPRKGGAVKSRKSKAPKGKEAVPHKKGTSALEETKVLASPAWDSPTAMKRLSTARQLSLFD